MPTIYEYPELLTITDNDFLLIWDATNNATKKIKVGNLKSYFNSIDSDNIFSYSSPGDTNGILFNQSGQFTISASSNLNGFNFGSITNLVDRGDASWASLEIANSSFTIMLNKTAKLNRYSLRGHTNNSQDQPRTWRIEGSNDNGNYTLLDSQSNNSSMGQGTWFVSPILSTDTFYKYFKITQTGVNSTGRVFFCLSEVELYGVLQ